MPGKTLWFVQRYRKWKKEHGKKKNKRKSKTREYSCVEATESLTSVAFQEIPETKTKEVAKFWVKHFIDNAKKEITDKKSLDFKDGLVFITEEIDDLNHGSLHDINNEDTHRCKTTASTEIVTELASCGDTNLQSKQISRHCTIYPSNIPCNPYPLTDGEFYESGAESKYYDSCFEENSNADKYASVNMLFKTIQGNHDIHYEDQFQEPVVNVSQFDLENGAYHDLASNPGDSTKDEDSSAKESQTVERMEIDLMNSFKHDIIRNLLHTIQSILGKKVASSSGLKNPVGKCEIRECHQKEHLDAKWNTSEDLCFEKDARNSNKSCEANSSEVLDLEKVDLINNLLGTIRYILKSPERNSNSFNMKTEKASYDTIPPDFSFRGKTGMQFQNHNYNFKNNLSSEDLGLPSYRKMHSDAHTVNGLLTDNIVRDEIRFLKRTYRDNETCFADVEKNSDYENESQYYRDLNSLQRDTSALKKNFYEEEFNISPTIDNAMGGLHSALSEVLKNKISSFRENPVVNLTDVKQMPFPNINRLSLQCFPMIYFVNNPLENKRFMQMVSSQNSNFLLQSEDAITSQNISLSEADRMLDYLKSFRNRNRFKYGEVYQDDSQSTNILEHKTSLNDKSSSSFLKAGTFNKDEPFFDSCFRNVDGAFVYTKKFQDGSEVSFTDPFNIASLDSTNFSNGTHNRRLPYPRTDLNECKASNYPAKPCFNSESHDTLNFNSYYSTLDNHSEVGQPESEWLYPEPNLINRSDGERQDHENEIGSGDVTETNTELAKTIMGSPKSKLKDKDTSQPFRIHNYKVPVNDRILYAPFKNAFLRNKSESKSHMRKLSKRKIRTMFYVKFRSHSKVSRGTSSWALMTSKGSTLWLTEAGIINKIFTTEEAEKAFKESAGKKVAITEYDYKAFLAKLSRQLKMPQSMLMEKMATFDLKI